jgi:hypothetical protein
LDELLEKLAALEHEQWIAWAATLMEKEPTISEDRKWRWRGLMISYGLLTEEVKEHDRKWARKVMEIIRMHIQEYGPL